MPRVALSFACGVALAACSLITNFDGFSGGASVDAGALSDARGDSLVDGGAGRYCESLRPAPAFCDDFDGLDGGAILADRSRAEARDDDFVSPPRGLRITVGPLNTGNTAAAFSVPLSSAAHRVTCRFDLKVEAAGGSTSVVSVQFVAGKDSAQVDLQLTPTGLAVTEYLAYASGSHDYRPHTETPVAWPSGWMHVELVWTDAFSSSLVVNGVALETNVPLHPKWFKGLATVSYGNVFANGVTKEARVMRMDNVTVDVE